jgi:hypothetical protein
MQFVQIDIVQMDGAMYKSGALYTHVLVVTDMFSKFMIARTLIDSNDTDRLIFRLLVEIFNMFGVPEGYSSTCCKDTIDRCMDDIARLFRVNIVSVTTSVSFFGKKFFSFQ